MQSNFPKGTATSCVSNSITAIWEFGAWPKPSPPSDARLSQTCTCETAGKLPAGV